MAERKIIITTEYVDKSSASFNRSFELMEKSVRAMSNSINGLSNSINKNMSNVRKDTAASMKGVDETLRRTTRAADEHIGGVARLAKSYEKFRIMAAQARNALLLFFFVFRPFEQAVRSAITAASEQEDATNRLNIALQNQGTFTGQLSEELNGLASEFQRTTRYGDEAIADVFTKLIATGDVLPSQLGKTTQAVLDFSTLTGRDLSTSADVFAKAAAGFTGQLSRYGIFIDRSIPKTEKFAAVLEQVNRRMGGAAQKDTETYSGKVAQLSNAFGELKESIGKSLIENFKLVEKIQGMTGVFNALSGSAGSIGDINKELANLNQITDDFGEPSKMNKFAKFFMSLSPVGAGIGMIGASAEKSKAKLTELMTKLDQFEFKYRHMTAELENNNKALEEPFANIRKFMVQLSEDQEKSFDERLKVINDEAKAFQHAASQRVKLQETVTRNITILEKKLADAVTNEQKRLLEQEIETQNQRLEELQRFADEEAKIAENRSKQIEDMLGGLPDFTEEMARGMTRGLEDGFFNIVTGRFRDLEDVVLAFGETMLRVILRMAAIKLVSAIFGGPVGFAAGGIGGGGAGFEGIMGHQGIYVRSGSRTSAGYSPKNRIGHLLPEAGSYHSGGEVRATLKEGEGVLNARAMRKLGVQGLNSLNNGNETQGGQIVNNYYIQTIDERSFRDRLSQNGDIYEGAAVRGISDNRQIRKTIQRHGT